MSFKRLFGRFFCAKKTKNGCRNGKFFVHLFDFLAKKLI
jgi:hypothetical protein